MDFEDLEKYRTKNREKPTYDLRLRIDGIPIDEHIITIEQVDKN